MFIPRITVNALLVIGTIAWRLRLTERVHFPKCETVAVFIRNEMYQSMLKGQQELRDKDLSAEVFFDE
ncbi:MAG: hypothetical protein K0A95_10865 [Chromatiales bacterium]|nr:hypothetical protein [Gammaproteobacteria bacterium]MBW6477558.1 hypothetical protein [Chromatiales bacterium]